jgi:threonine dehydrogenase-like Zn-dependent dehydrogenase
MYAPALRARDAAQVRACAYGVDVALEAGGAPSAIWQAKVDTLAGTMKGTDHKAHAVMVGMPVLNDM